MSNQISGFAWGRLRDVVNFQSGCLEGYKKYGYTNLND